MGQRLSDAERAAALSSDARRRVDRAILSVSRLIDRLDIECLIEARDRAVRCLDRLVEARAALAGECPCAGDYFEPDGIGQKGHYKLCPKAALAGEGE